MFYNIANASYPPFYLVFSCVSTQLYSFLKGHFKYLFEFINWLILELLENVNFFVCYNLKILLNHESLYVGKKMQIKLECPNFGSSSALQLKYFSKPNATDIKLFPVGSGEYLFIKSPCDTVRNKILSFQLLPFQHGGKCMLSIQRLKWYHTFSSLIEQK